MPEEFDQGALEAEGEERPEWLPTQYRDPEAFRKGWEEQNRTLTQAQQRAAEAERRALEAEQRAGYYEQQAAQPQQQYDPNTDPQIMMMAQAFDEGDTARYLALQDQRFAQIAMAAQQMQAQQAQKPDHLVGDLAVGYVEQEVARRLGADYESLRGDLEQTLQTMPHAVRDPRDDPMGTVEDVVRIAGWIKSEKALAERSEQLNTQQQQAQQMKRLSQSAYGGGRVTGTPDARAELIEKFRQVQKTGPGSLAG